VRTFRSISAFLAAALLAVACQGDGSIHVIDIPGRRAKGSFKAGTGCESVGFF